MKLDVPFLHRVNGRLRYRRVIKPHLRPYFGKREWKEALSLRVGQEAQAISKVNAINKQFEAFERLAERAQINGVEPKLFLKDPIAFETNPHKLAAEAERWALENKFIGLDKSGLGYEDREDPDSFVYSAYDNYIEAVDAEAQRRVGYGRDVHLRDLTPLDQARIATVKRGEKLKPEVTLERAIEAYTEFKGGVLPKAEDAAFAQLREWLKVSNEFPQYNIEGYIHLKWVKKANASKFLRYLADERGQADSTVRRRLNSVRAMWSYAIDHFELEDIKNPWSNPRFSGTKPSASDKTSVLPFTADHLGAIQRGMQANSVDPELKLLLRVLRCTGARPSEVAGLRSNDIHIDGDQTWIMIDFNEIRRIKNSGSIRRVPIVDPMVAAELKQLAERKEGRPLFQKGFHDPSNLSHRSNKFLRTVCDIPKSARLVPYSFRHTVVEALRVSSTHPDLIKAIVGHSKGSVTENYGAGSASLERMRAALEGAMGKLGEVDTYHYRPEELMQDVDLQTREPR